MRDSVLCFCTCISTFCQFICSASDVLWNGLKLV
jgi:hypothetical protein